MEIRGQCELPASPATAWCFLATPAQVSQCVPGLVSWEVIEPDKQFQLWLRWAFVPASPPMVPVLLTWASQQPPDFLHLSLSTQLGLQPVQAAAQLILRPLSLNQTQLDFVIAVDTVNRFTEQIIRSHSPKLIDTFFREIQCRLAAES